ncbi:MAG TPA: addiction module protein [Tepidisphaeraceae bacterium]|nr:addiction module protein [Tepidisphaeraceae bacterium]
MTKPAEHILQEALALDAADRMELVDRLSETLAPSDDPEYTAAWEAEIRDRIQQVKRGQSAPLPWKEAMNQIERGEGDAE